MFRSCGLLLLNGMKGIEPNEWFTKKI
jgi:hypothetical protein